MACRDCGFYDIERVKNVRGAILSNRRAKCLWISTEVWPDSVPNVSWNQRPTTSFMAPNDGDGCKRFIKQALPHEPILTSRPE